MLLNIMEKNRKNQHHSRMAPLRGPEMTRRRMYAHIRKQCACGEDSTLSPLDTCPFLWMYRLVMRMISTCDVSIRLVR